MLLIVMLLIFLLLIFWKGNKCADKLANPRVDSKNDFMWFHTSANCVQEDFFKNKYSLPEFRCC